MAFISLFGVLRKAAVIIGLWWVGAGLLVLCPGCIVMNDVLHFLPRISTPAMAWSWMDLPFYLLVLPLGHVFERSL